MSNDNDNDNDNETITEVICVRGPWRDDYTGFYTVDKVAKGWEGYAPYSVVLHGDDGNVHSRAYAVKIANRVGKKLGIKYVGEAGWDSARAILRRAQDDPNGYLIGD